MPIKAVIISLVVALVLGGAAYFTLQEKGPTVPSGVVPAGGLVLDIDPAQVKSVRVRAPDGEVQGVERAADSASTPGGAWVAVVNVGKPAERRWPLQSSAAASLLRQLAQARAIAEATTDDVSVGVGADPTVVTITMNDGATRTLRLAARTLGGRGLVEVSPPAPTGADAGVKKQAEAKPLLAIVDDGLHRVFRSPGPKGWRDPAAISGIGPDVARIRLSNVDRSVVLGKVEGRWAVIEPVGAPANPESIRRLISLLSELTIETFYDEAPPSTEATGLATPIARSVVESDRTDMQGSGAGQGSGGGSRVITTTRELNIGNSTDTTLKKRFASLGGDVTAAGAVVTVTAAGLSPELFMPSQYISPRAVETPVGDVGGVVLEAAAPPAPASVPVPAPGNEGAPSPVAGAAAPSPGASFPTRVFRRSLDTWKEIADGKETTLEDDQGKLVTELVGFLAGESPAAVELSPPAGWKDVGRVSLLSLGGQPIGVLDVGSTGAGAIGVKTSDVKGRAVYRTYAPGRAPVLLSPVAAAAKAAADAAPKPPASPDDDVMK